MADLDAHRFGRLPAAPEAPRMTGARVLEAFDPTASSIIVKTELGDVPIGNPNLLHTDEVAAVMRSPAYPGAQ